MLIVALFSKNNDPITITNIDSVSITNNSDSVTVTITNSVSTITDSVSTNTCCCAAGVPTGATHQ